MARRQTDSVARRRAGRPRGERRQGRNAGRKHLEEIHIGSLSLEPMHGLLDRKESAQFDRTIGRARKLLAGRVVWNINSTAVGGGVAEMLQSLLAYARGAGIDARWLGIRGGDAFSRGPSGRTTSCTVIPAMAKLWARPNS